MLPKNGAAKREKSKDFLKLRNDHRPLIELNNTANAKDPTGPDILTPRPFIIDLIDCIGNNKNELNKTPRRGNKLRALMPTKNATGLLTNGKENECSDTPRSKWQSPNSRQYSTIAQIDTSRRKPVVKPIESGRRHASCGPRLITAAAAAPVEEPSKPEVETNNNTIDVNVTENKPLTCVGSKCCVDNETSITLPPPIAPPSRKQSLETPRLFPNKPKLKPLNVVNTSASKCSHATTVGNAASKSAKFLSTSNKEYRKYVNHMQMSKLQPKSAVNDSYCSHFFAVGLSLRAWRSKYNQILKSQNDNVQLAQSYGPISSRKSKRLEPK